MNEIIQILSLAEPTRPVSVGVIKTQIFSDGEVCTDYKTSVRGKTVYLLSSPNTAAKREQLDFAIDAAKRAAATEIIPILPYLPYARQEVLINN